MNRKIALFIASIFALVVTTPSHAFWSLFNSNYTKTKYPIVLAHGMAGFDNIYLVGGGTHPGSGLPTIYESGRISSNLICESHGKENSRINFADEILERAEAIA